MRPAKSDKPLPRLSEREVAVLQACSTGASSDEVADTLGWPVLEVEQALRSSMYSLGVGSKLEAILQALRLGILQPPG